MKQYFAPPIVAFKLFPKTVNVDESSLGPKEGDVTLPLLEPLPIPRMADAGPDDTVKLINVNAEDGPSTVVIAKVSVPGKCTGNLHDSCNEYKKESIRWRKGGNMS